MIRIQEDCTPEVAAALDVLHKEMKNRNLKRNGKQPLREGEARHDEIETAIIQALAPLQDTQDFGEVISKTNDHKQTLAHFAVHFGYTTLLRQLVGWNIDLSIADVNGFTALHCAYKKGDRVCVDLLLEKGASETVVDVLGRAPSQLMPEGFASLDDHDTDTASDGQGQLRYVSSLLHSVDSWDGASDSGGERSTDKAVLADPMHQSQSSSVASNSQRTLYSAPLPVHSPPVPDPTVTFAPKFLPVPHSTSTLDVIIMSPSFRGDSYIYRQFITAQLILTGTAVRQFNQVVLGPTTPTTSQLALWCYAECRSCRSSAHPKCTPVGWCLDPVRDRKSNLDFRLNLLSDALTGNITFNIPHRPRRPMAQDQMRRCHTESLM